MKLFNFHFNTSLQQSSISDFLEIRRTSRCSTELVTDPQVRFTDVWSNYQNLGPLPALPAEPQPQSDWSRRQSAVSGIYEEIPDPQAALRGKCTEKTPERNVDEIYERLYRRRSNTVTQSLLAQTPPPLPPRPRINTLERGEDTLKKKKYKSVLESIFGGKLHGHSRKGSESSTDDPPSAREDTIRQKFDMDLLAHHLQGNLEKNKRHSMSTPELANWDEAVDQKRERPAHGCRLSEEDEVDVSEWQDVSCMSLLSESLDISAELNISDKIRPNYNLSMNASTVNLVGCNFNAVRESEIGLRDDGEKRRSLNSVNGYCVMKPIPSQSPSSEEEGVNVLIPDETEKSSGYCPMGPLGFDPEHVRCLDQQPVRGIVFNEDRVKLLDSLKNVTVTRGSSGDDDDEDAHAAEKRFEEEECFLRRKVITTPKREPLNSQRDEDLYENCKDRRSSRGSKYLVDDKMPSYFPNASPPPQTTTTTTTPTNQITPPKLVPKQRSRSSMTPSPRMQHYSPRAVPNIYSVPRNNSPVLMDNARDTEMLKQSLTDNISKLSLISGNNSPATSPAPPSPGSRGSSKRREGDGEARSRGGSPARIDGSPEKKRFDTIQSPVSHKYLDKCSLKADFANLKKFASLPRFRKLDLSPLRIKLNSVLHRNNSEF